MGPAVVGLLTLVLAYAVFWYGGVRPAEWNICLLAIGLLSVMYSLRRPKAGFAPPLDRTPKWLVLLMPAYAGFQLVPLPISCLKFLSPARAELLAGLAPVLRIEAFAPLSIQPSATVAQALRITGYTAVFLLVREMTWRYSGRPWTVAVSIIGLGVLEAGIGLFQYAADPTVSFGRGTYVNRNHFAGLLEMMLPFAVMYPLAILSRGRSRLHSPVLPAAKACVGFASAALILTGIVYSLSRMGLIAALSSLFVMGALALTGRIKSRKKIAVLLLATAVLLCFVLLQPSALVTRFAGIASTEEITPDLRLRIWGETLHVVRAYPLFGCGLGAFETAFLKYKTTALLWRVDFAHNDYLQFLAEAGVCGFMIAAALVAGVSRKALCATSPHLQPESRYLALACTGSITAILIHSLVDFNLSIPANAMLLAWVFGLSSGLVFSSRRQPAWEAFGFAKVIEGTTSKAG